MIGMLKLLRFLFGGEPLFGNSNKGMFRNLEVSKEEIIPNTKIEQIERTHRETIPNNVTDETRSYGSTDLRFGYRGKLENSNTNKVGDTSGITKFNSDNKTRIQKQLKPLE
jgi:hypothetical protein